MDQPNQPPTPVPSTDIMIVKKDRNRDRFKINVRKRMLKGYSPNNYSKVLNPKDFNDLAILFEDLALVIGAPVDKAYHKYRENRGDKFIY